MKIAIIILIISVSVAGIYLYSIGFWNKGSINRFQFKSQALVNNLMGEDPNRHVTIYLPFGYKESDKKYPVIYFLHGFGSDDEASAKTDICQLFDKAIQRNLIAPCILVFPNSYTKFKGSFYTNSDTAGRWADYIAKDLVEYIDKNYKTIPNKNSRGIAGHSMGGNGALKLAMLYPDVFSSVYALSPSILYWAEELSTEHEAFKIIYNAKTLEEVQNQHYPIGFLSMGSTYSANPNKPPFYCDMPVNYPNGVKQIDSSVFAIWDKEFPLKMIPYKLSELRSLKGIGFDWGQQDEYAHLPPTCKEFSKMLNSYNIKHSAEEYQGDHTNKIGNVDGRVYTKLIPFFAQHLEAK